MVLTDSTTTQTLADVTSLVNPGVAWAVPVSYAEPFGDDPLTLTVSRSNAVGTSPDITVNVLQAVRLPVTVTITQDANSNQAGSLVYVNAYTDPDELFATVASAQLPVMPGQPASGTVSLRLPVALTTHVRAFRDANADGYPTMELLDGTPEAQSATAVGGPLTLNLREPDTTAEQMVGMNALTVNSAHRDRNPACGGFHLLFQAQFASTGDDLSPVRVQLPQGTTLTLANDGACDCGSGGCSNNETESYDLSPGDTKLTAGIAQARLPAAGTFVMAYRNRAADFVDAAVDELDRYRRMPFTAIPTAPTGALAVAPGDVNVQWNPVADANVYRLFVGPSFPSTSCFAGEVTTTAQTVSGVADQSTLNIQILPEYREGSDVDAKAESDLPTVWYATVASNPADVVTLSGSVTNMTGTSGQIHVAGAGCALNLSTPQCSGQLHASVALAPAQSAFELAVLKDSMTNRASVLAYVLSNADRDPVLAHPGRVLGIDGTQDVSNVTITIYKQLPRIQVSGPQALPLVQWRDWSSLAGPEPAQWTYVVYAAGDPFALPPLVMAVPPTQLSYDMNNPPAVRVDLVAHASGGNQTSITELSTAENTVAVGILPCAFETLDTNGCVDTALANPVFINALVTDSRVGW